jgi:microcystin-dependent protein
MDPYVSEIKLVAFNFAPKGWFQCNGQLLPINQNQALFSLLGTMYGGNGQTNFALPNLQGRAPNHVGPGYIQGQAAGEYNHTLITNELPLHIHLGQAVNVGQNSNSPTNNMLANTSGALTVYGMAAPSVAMWPADISNSGGSQPHPNQSPYLVMNWIICLNGIFPSRN